MPKNSIYARISITLPAADLAAADRLARAFDRPRSWVFAEGVRRLAAAGLGQSRTAQLAADLLLTPEARVRAAEETLRVDASRGGPPPERLVQFDRYDEYLDWKRRRGAGA